MFARLSIYEIDEERIDDAVKGFDDALETIAHMKGLSDAYFLVNRDDGRGVALTLWESHDAMAASRVTASRLRIEVANRVEGTVMSVDEFEIATHRKAPIEISSSG